MPYIITFQPVNRILGVTPGMVTKPTAATAWAEVQMLHACDERTEITDESGRSIRWQDLRDTVAKEANCIMTTLNNGLPRA